MRRHADMRRHVMPHGVAVGLVVSLALWALLALLAWLIVNGLGRGDNGAHVYLNPCERCRRRAIPHCVPGRADVEPVAHMVVAAAPLSLRLARGIAISAGAVACADYPLPKPSEPVAR